MAVSVQEDSETLLARSRAKITGLWLDLQSGKIKRAELNRKMTEYLDDLEVNHRDAYLALQPELPLLRRAVIGDNALPSFTD